jgi:SAM-dependent methyltransferase
MSGDAPPALFDRELVRRRIARALPRFADHSALFDDCAAQLDERLGEVAHPFRDALDLSPFPFLSRREGNAFTVLTPSPVPDEELLPFAPESFDLVVSNLGLHWVNDLPGALAQCRAALKPKGMFLAAMAGGQTLREMRECLTEAEIFVAKGASPRVSPMVDLKTAGDLLRRANFHLPVADIETVTLLYPDMFSLIGDLRGTGQANAHIERLRRPTRRAVFSKAADLYWERYVNADGLVSATFDIIYLHGWK